MLPPRQGSPDSASDCLISVGNIGHAGPSNGDGVPDLLVGSGSGITPQVHVYSGKTGDLLTSVLPFDDQSTGGVRVATAYVDNDQYADIVVGGGAGTTSRIQVFSGHTGEVLDSPLGSYTPFGQSHSDGVYVAASNDPPQPPYAGDGYPHPLVAGASETGTTLNTPPRITNPSLQFTVNEDDQIDQTVTAVDNEDAHFIFTATGLPPGLEIAARSGKISGWVDPRAANGSSKSYAATISVQDLKGGQVSTTYTYTVNHTNHAPRLYGMYPVIAQKNVPFAFNTQGGYTKAVDIDTGDTLTYSFTGLPPGLTSANTTITGSPTTTGQWDVSDTVSDGHGGSDTRIFKLIVTVPPAVGTPAPPTVQMSSSSAFNPIFDPSPTAVMVGQPETIFVRLGQPDGTNPSAPVPVTLAAPTGVTLSPASFSIVMNQTQAVTVTLTAASTKLADVTVTATVPK